MRGLIVPVPDATATIKGKQVLPADASLTNKGLVEIATTPETASGASASLAIAPLGLLFAQGFSDYYASGEITITTGSLSTNAHGMGRTPQFIQMKAICKTAEDGWSVNDEFFIAETSPNGSSARRPGVYADSTNVYLRFPNSAPVLQYMNKSSGAYVDLTDANWRIKIKAWA